jgi:hypothetical protein
MLMLTDAIKRDSNIIARDAAVQELPLLQFASYCRNFGFRVIGVTEASIAGNLCCVAHDRDMRRQRGAVGRFEESVMRRVKFIPMPGTPAYDAVSSNNSPTPDTPPVPSDPNNRKKMGTTGRTTIFYRRGDGKTVR